MITAPLLARRRARRRYPHPRTAKPYLLAGDVFVVAALFLTFDLVRADASLWILVGALGVGVALIAPLDETRRVYVSIPLLLLVGWLLSTYLWAVDHERFQSQVFWLVPITAGAVVVGSVLPTQRIIRSLTVGLGAGIALQYLALIANPGEATSSTAGETTEVVRGWDGTFGHKNGLAVFVIFTFVTFLVLSPPSRVRTGVMVACVPLLVGSQSSTGFSCFFVVVLVAVWMNIYLRQRNHFSSAYLALSGVAFAALLCLLTAILPTIVNLYGKDLTFSGRTNIWAASIPAISENPIKGYGLGGVFFNHALEPTVSIDRRAGFIAWHAHNSVLEMLLEAGLVGLVLYVAFFGSIVVAAWRALPTRPDLAKLILIFAAMQFVVGLSEVALLAGWIFILVLLRGMLATATRTTVATSPDAAVALREPATFAVTRQTTSLRT